jgi:predicted neutral ceramidase superfamily lipid hydrolase
MRANRLTNWPQQATMKSNGRPLGVCRLIGDSTMAQTKIKDEDTLVRAVKKAHQQVQNTSKKLKAVKQEIAALRKEFDEKPPSDISEKERKAYESIAKEARSVIDKIGKTYLKDAERLLVESHNTLNGL